MKKYLTIGRLASALGVNVQTVRYYERRGLLLPRERDNSGYRRYDEESVRRLRFIVRAKALGFTLLEIKDLLNLRVQGSASCERVRVRASEKLMVVEEKVRALISLQEVLQGLVDSCDKRSATEECPILRVLDGE